MRTVAQKREHSSSSEMLAAGGATPSVEGHVDNLTRSGASGWAWVPGQPEQAVQVEAVLGERVIGRAVANEPRPDLAQYGKGKGQYGFTLKFEDEIQGDEAPQFRIAGYDSSAQLAGPHELPPVSVNIVHALSNLSGADQPDVSPIEGHVDNLTRSGASGWAWVPGQPEQAVQVEAVLGERVIGRAVANEPRPDLAQYGKGKGQYGFTLKFEDEIQGDEAPQFRILVTAKSNLVGASQLPPADRAARKRTTRGSIKKLLDEHHQFTSAGPAHEEFDPTILSGAARHPNVLEPLLLAFYLPQFHPIDENDRFWGRGFTEWRQLPRGISRFPGHYQPRIPRDLGFYNLRDLEALRRQVELATASGVNGFAYYYYWFNKQRVLEEPLDMLLASDVEMPFLIIWANENWTRTWDGSESEVLLRQDYREEDEQELLSDLARHFKDPRYIKVDGRPLFIIYNPAAVPDPLVTIARWRKSLQDSHDVDPLIFMAQTFGRRDPRPYGLDGAIEFPPHKLSDTLPGRATPDAYSSDFQGRVIDYDDFCRVSLSEEEPEFPLIKTVVPSWDNECRRPNRGLSLEDSSPEKYQRWLQILIERSIERPVIDTPIVAINAWNEWAEGAYLEPDVYFGAAYLNATARAYVTAVNRLSSSPAPTRTTVAGEKRVSVILPNFNHERFLEERIGSVVSQSTPPDEIIFLDDCSSDGSVALAEALLSKSGIPYQIVVNSVNSGGVFRQWMKGLELAKNDLVWIAETDDAAHPDFLTETLPYFERDDISAVFGRIQCVDDQGNSLPDLETYFDNLVDFSWHVSCVVPAYRAFRRDFAIRNVVPNASGLVFRKPHLSAQEQQRLFEYRFAGDWYFYALVLRGGALAYSRKARSFFRLSRSGTSRSSFFSDQHLLEHKMVLEDLDCQFRLPKEAVEEHIKALQPLFPNKSESTLLSYLTPEPTSAGPVRPLRICIAAHSFAVGGGEILPVELANELKGSGHHITFLVIEKIDIETTRTIRERLRADIPVVYWDDIKGNFNGFLADFGIEILNSHNVSVEFNLFVHGMRPKVRYVASLHGGYETVPHLMTSEFASYLTETVDRWLYLSEKNTTLLKQNGVSADTFGRIFNAVPTLLSGSIDRAAFRKTHSIPSDATVLFMCSRAIEEKGWRAAIEVTQALRAARGPNIYLVLIGEGPSAEELKSVYDSAGWVIFLGHIDNPARYFSCFDIGIFPSTFSGETFPLFIVECFQAGVPVVATDIGEIPYMLAEGPSGRPGVLVAHNQGRLHLVYEMIKCLQELLDDQPRLGQLRTAAADASKRFSMERLGDEYSRLFTNLTCAE